MTLETANWISLAALLVAGLALWLNYLTRRDQKRDKTPILTVEHFPGELERLQAPAGWHLFRVTLRSRNSQAYKVEAMSIVSPRGARIAKPRRNAERSEFVIKPHPPIPAAEQFRTMPMRLSVAHAGKEGSTRGGVVFARGDEHHEDFLVSIAHSKRSWMRLSFGSIRSIARSTSSSTHLRCRISFSVSTHSDSTERMVIEREISVPIKAISDPQKAM